MDQVPPAYVEWLLRNGINFHHENFRAALYEHRDIQKAKAEPLPPTMLNPSHKRRLSESGHPSSPAVSKRQHLSPQTSAVSENDPHTYSDAADPSSSFYRLPFGKHVGKTLDELPSFYIDWLVRNGVSNSNPDLASALKIKNRSRLATWVRPSPNDADDLRFFDRDTCGALWISTSDVFKYFHVDVRLLALTRIMPIIKGARRYSLYPVYACAKHFRTVEQGTVDQALAEFLNKNNKREQEKMAEMGLTCCCPPCCGEDQSEYYAAKLPSGNFTTVALKFE